MKQHIYNGLASVLVLVFAVSLFAQESETGHSHEKAERHGGSVTMTSDHHFEVVPMMNGIAVFAYDMHQNPVPVNGVTGTVKVMLRSGKSMTVDLKPYSAMHSSQMMRVQGHGMMGNTSSQMSNDNSGNSFFGMNAMLWGNLDLSNLDAKEAKVSIHLKGLQDKDESNVDFRDTMHLTHLPNTMHQAMERAESHHGDEEHEMHSHNDNRGHRMN